MKTKLTLSIDEDLVRFAHQEAKRKDTSISDIFSKYLRQRQAKVQPKNIPTISEMRGALKGVDIDYSKEGIRNAYAEKYLNRFKHNS